MNGTVTHTSDWTSPVYGVTAIANDRADRASTTRELIAYAHKLGAEHATYSFDRADGTSYGPVEHVWTLKQDRVVLTRDQLIYVRRGAPLLKAEVTSPRQVAQLLAAIGVLPQRFIGGAL